MRHQTILFIILSIIFLGCNSAPSSATLIKSHKIAANEKFDQFYKCFDIALNTPPITEDNVNWIGNSPPVLKYGSSNVYQVGIESFKDLAQPLDVPFDGTRRREHADMAQLFGIDLSSKKVAHNYNIDAKYSFHEVTEEPGDICSEAIMHFLNCKYLLINRINEHQKASLISETVYEEGYGKGDVLIFDVEAAKLIGGYTVLAKSDRHMSINENADVYNNLNADLEMNIYDHIKAKFLSLSPELKEEGSFDF